MPGGSTTIEIVQNSRRTTARTMSRPNRHSTPMLAYHTPRRMNRGHSGNMTAASITTTMPSPASFIMSCCPS